MELIDKARILSDFFVQHRFDADAAYFVEVNDLGLPYAFGIANGDILTLSSAGEDSVNETYAQLLTFLAAPDDEYDSLSDLFDSSTNGRGR
mgnify:CR=1 FL=1|jgi:hypothetical protein